MKFARSQPCKISVNYNQINESLLKSLRQIQKNPFNNEKGVVVPIRRIHSQKKETAKIDSLITIIDIINNYIIPQLI